MHNFVIGQRWINNAELQLGLGTILSVEQRTITILFQATGETRTYAKQSAALTRVMFAKGDSVTDHQGQQIKVESVTESSGLLTYFGKDNTGKQRQLVEALLDHQIRLNRPLDRLLTGQIDENRWFDLRCQTLLQLNRISHSGITGLMGGRTDLIPHQLYIAYEISRRYAPRVLLADEVGLGKTIEAGLILHEQLHAERIRRVLIIVPENLLHQWLVEMLRRFNLRFSLFDKERYDAITENDATENPFEQEQLVLCSLNLLTDNQTCLQHLLAAGWDMLVVDEAHHLTWSPDHASVEYQIIEQIAAATDGVLLLTATPEQLGKAGHYARLRLLDPGRFPDFDRFIEEEKSYEPVAEAIESLFDLGKLSAAEIKNIRKLLGEDTSSLDSLLADTDPAARVSLMNRLLDQHGTGRVLFRNTRAAVKGFPERQAKAYPLSAPAQYAALNTTVEEDCQKILSLELHYQSTTTAEATHWTRIDPRLLWLKEKLQALKPAKILVICSSNQTALDITGTLKLKYGIHATSFHTGLGIIERDRAAAYFADDEAGAQVLVCSEIGSEGRNFQFAHHLVLFDLPLNPDLLEQRIGRLDRIGQKHPVQIHIPYIEGTAQALMYDWYQRGLDAFTRPCHAGQAVYNDVKERLLDTLRNNHSDAGLIQQTQQQFHILNDALEKGRDRLLEYNSCWPEIANNLHRMTLDEDKASTLPAYMDRVFDCFGVHSEEHSSASLILSPAENMLTTFPHLPDDGLTVTYNRKTALAHEDRHFLTWAHPMVTSAIELVLGNEHGNTAVIAFKHTNFKAGTLLLECNYLLDSATASSPHVRRYLPPALIRLVLDDKGKNHDQILDYQTIEKNMTAIDRDTAAKVVALKQDVIRQLFEHSNKLALAGKTGVIEKVRASTAAMLTGEIERLRELAKVNPNVRSDEIAFFESELHETGKMFDSVLPRLDAIRVLIAT